MATLSSTPETSSHDQSAPKEKHHARTHHKHASSGAEGHHTEAKATHHTTHHRPNGPRRSSTYDRVGGHDRTHERTHERTHADRDGKGSEEPSGKRFKVTKLLATPFFLLGGALSAAGGVLFGVGSMVKGFGGGKECRGNGC